MNAEKNDSMTNCDFCHRSVGELRRCPYCNGNFCSFHAMLESHHCKNPKMKARKIKSAILISAISILCIGGISYLLASGMVQNMIEKSSTLIPDVSKPLHNVTLQANAPQGTLVDNTHLYADSPSSEQGSGTVQPSGQQGNAFSVTIASPPTITRTMSYRLSESLSTPDSHGLYKESNGNSSSGNFYTEEARYSSYDLKTEELEKQIHGLINQERAKNNLPVLSYNDDLAFIARNHSYDMATRNYFSHDTPEGLTPEQRGIHIGYTTCGTLDAINLSEQYDYDVKLFESTGKTDQNLYDKLQGEYQQLQTMHLYLVGENIFQNNIFDSYETTDGIISHYDWNDPDKIAMSTVQGWINSTGHRENILTAWHTEGIGVEISNDYKVYITEDFC